TNAEQGVSLDPTGRHELAGDFFHTKTGTAASYFTADRSPEKHAPYYEAADAILATQPAPEPEPEWKPGTVAEITVHPSGVLRAVRARVGDCWAADTEEVYSDDELESVRPLVVIEPADINLTALGDAYDHALESADLAWTYADRDPYAGIKAVLAHLGLNR